jgi:hypothetical protein
MFEDDEYFSVCKHFMYKLNFRLFPAMSAAVHAAKSVHASGAAICNANRNTSMKFP